MAIKLQLRNGIAASWASVNPTLSQGEIGTVTDTAIFKIGDGVSNWNSLSVAQTASPAQTIPWVSLGDGSDGITSITTSVVLSRDMYYSNLTISGAGQINTNGYKIFVNGVLDLTSSTTAAINFNAGNGFSASGSSSGASVVGVSSGSIGGTQTGGAGVSGTTGTGTTGSAGTTGNNGGNSNSSGAGGAGGSGAGGASGGGSAITTPSFMRRFETNLIRGVSLTLGGSGGRGGASGAGDGVNSGGGGGGAGGGGGVIALYANTIIRSSSTAQATIQCNGGIGGNGGTATLGTTGGGGAGGGGGGGWVYLVYNYMVGPVTTNFIQANGGAGGNGGNGSASNTVGGGSGGTGGYGGRITLFNVTTQTGQEVYGYNTTAENPQVTTGNLGLFSVGGQGCVGGLCNLTI